MGSDYKLATLEYFLQAAQHIPLPFRVQVQFDFVDKDQRHALGNGVVAVRVAVVVLGQFIK